jgi:SAM-dependent methyltransferase
MSDWQQQNQQAWDNLADNQSLFAKVATDEECLKPLDTLDSRGWIPRDIRGRQVLCLASGGGWQSILYAAAGADVTVVDLSPSMLSLDERESKRRGFPVRVLQGSMTDLSLLEPASFDIVHQPVSTCYVPDVTAVYKQVARVLRDGGLYISQHKSPTSLQVVDRDANDRYAIGVRYYHTGPLPDVPDTSYREPGAIEYLHRWADLVGGLCRSGFVLEDLREPYRGDETAPPGHFRHRGLYVPPYVRLKARRVASPASPLPDAVAPSERPLWLPPG